MDNIFDELKWRGFVEQIAGEDELKELLAKEKIVCYCGFDPSASSLHIGNFLAIMLLVHFQRYGHKPLALVGGATGMIGDPSGKSKERNLIGPEQVAENASEIKKQLSRFLDFEGRENNAVLLNNFDWLGKFSFIDFLRDVGKYFRIGEMLAKDSVKNRLSREEGVSYAEFSYMLMQSYDFLHLFDNFNCRLQLGGNDQWGNITSGIDFVRKLRSKSVYGLTTPLITGSDGQKLGKSVDGAVWLNKEKMSVFDFYQFWFRIEDDQVIKLLKLFTFLKKEEIEVLENSLNERPEDREAQKTLAYEVTKLVHGKNEADGVIRASQVLYGEEIKGFSDEVLKKIFAEVPTSNIEYSRLKEGINLIDLMAEVSVAPSKGAARKLLQGGGIYINNIRIESINKKVNISDLASESLMIIRSGKKNYHLINFA